MGVRVGGVIGASARLATATKEQGIVGSELRGVTKAPRGFGVPGTAPSAFSTFGGVKD